MTSLLGNAILAEQATSYAAIGAAGTTQGTATPITQRITLVSGADNTAGTILPAATVGDERFIINVESTNRALVYPAVGEKIIANSIGDAGTNNYVNIGGLCIAHFVCGTAGVWNALLGTMYYGNNSDWNVGTGTLTCGKLDAAYRATFAEYIAAARAIGADGLHLADSKPLLLGTGDDVAVNGAFSADTDWTKGSGWTIAGGVAVAATASTDLAATAAPLTSGRIYKLTYTIVSRSVGEVTPKLGTAAGTTRTVPGTYTELIAANNTGLAFTGNGFTGSIDNVSCVLTDVKMYWDGSKFTFIVAGAEVFSVAASAITFDEATNVVLGTTTGTKFGTSTAQKLAFFDATPIVQRVGAPQAAVDATGATITTPYGYSEVQANAIVTLVNELRAAMIAFGLIKGSA